MQAEEILVAWCEFVEVLYARTGGKELVTMSCNEDYGDIIIETCCEDRIIDIVPHFASIGVNRCLVAFKWFAIGIRD